MRIYLLLRFVNLCFLAFGKMVVDLSRSIKYAISKPKTFAGISFYVFFLILASVKLVNYTNLPIRGAASVCFCIENRMNACAFRDIWARVMFSKLSKLHEPQASAV